MSSCPTCVSSRPSAAALAGLVLTHAHEDHFGAVIELWPRLQVPIYATPFTAALLKAKLAEYGGGAKLPIHEVALNSRFDVGPFGVELISVAHSIPESNALAISTPHGLVLHTGDWKLDPTPVIGAPTDTDRLAALGCRGRDGDGLRFHQCLARRPFSIRAGRGPVAGAHHQGGAKRRVAVTIFASNVARLRAVADAARRGRAAACGGRPGHASHDRRRDFHGIPAARTSSISIRISSPTCNRMRSSRCAPAARASRVRRWPASLQTSIPRSSSTGATSSSSPRARSRATSARWVRFRTGWSTWAASWSPTTMRWCM